MSNSGASVGQNKCHVLSSSTRIMLEGMRLIYGLGGKSRDVCDLQYIRQPDFDINRYVGRTDFVTDIQ